MQAPDSHSILATAKELWGYIGPLVGLYAGNSFSRSAQRKQWLLDRRKEELREVVSAMTQATIELQTYLAAKGAGTEQPWSLWIDAHKAAFRIVADRIYIAEDLAQRDIPNRYIAAALKLHDSNDPESSAANEMGEIINEVVKLATKVK